MTNFKSLMMVAAAVVILPASAGASDKVGYLGSRDDIIIKNAGDVKSESEMATTAVKTEMKAAASEEMEKTAAKAESMADETMTEVTEIDMPKMGAEAEEVRTVSQATEPMKTITMKTVKSEQISTTAVASVPTGAQGDVPPNARPGECYAKVLIPAITETKTKRIQVSEEQKVVARMIPAEYATQTERIQVKEARTYWKPGKGPITKADEVTGEILCLVEEPAEYKTIEKRVLVTPERPEYKMIPAKFETVTKTNVITPETWEWRRILCETNLSANAIMQIQRALNLKGYNVAPDGRLGDATMNAINNYQLKNGLASRGITYETLSHMGVSLAGA